MRWYEIALPVLLLVIGVLGMIWGVAQALEVIKFFNQVNP
jgi:hypothetical protein